MFGEALKRMYIPPETATLLMAYLIFMEFVIASQFRQTGGIKMPNYFKVLILIIKHLIVYQGVSDDTPSFYYVK